MSTATVSLLTCEDLQGLEAHGVSATPRADLLAPGRDGTLYLTAKGLEYYQAALAAQNLPVERAFGVDSLQALTTLALDIKMARLNRAAQMLAGAVDSNALAVRSRETAQALLTGSLQEFETSVARQSRFAAAGSNVIPVRFRKSA
jgi:hypothetical protein